MHVVELANKILHWTNKRVKEIDRSTKFYTQTVLTNSQMELSS